MKAPQLKQINKTEINQVKNIPKQDPKKTQQEKNQTIKSLPTWSIEPPLEIKRGNQ